MECGPIKQKKLLNWCPCLQGYLQFSVEGAGCKLGPTGNGGLLRDYQGGEITFLKPIGVKDSKFLMKLRCPQYWRQ